MAAWAHRAEELGFDSVWISDHFFYSFARYGADPQPIASLEPMTALAGLAAVTERVRLGTLVLCAPFRHPSILAKMAATIDQLSGGRLDLGIGAGWLEQEFEAFGYPFGTVGERFEALEETLQVLEALFSGAPATFDGPDGHAPRRPAPPGVGAGAADPGVGGRQGRTAAAASGGSSRRRLERRVALGARGLRRAGRGRQADLRTGGP